MKKVFCLGVWDLLHYGHLVLLTRSAKLGELTVGIVCDKAVKKEKGKDRPIYDEFHRAEIIKCLSMVSDRMLLEDFIIPKQVIEAFDIIIVGEDQTHIKNLDEIAETKKHILPRYEGVSTSKLVERIKNL